MGSSVRESQIDMYQSSIEKLEQVQELMGLLQCLQPFVKEYMNRQQGTGGSDADEGRLIFMKYGIVYSQYIRKVKEQMETWTGNILSRQVESFFNSDTGMLSSNSDDIIQLVNMQLEVAREHMDIQTYIEGVFSICLEEVQNCIRKRMKAEDIEVEELCIIVNDSQNLWERFSEMSKEIDLSQRDIQDSRYASDGHYEGFLTISHEATEQIADIVLRDLESKVLVHVFSESWMKEENEVVSAVIATMEDYFSDLDEWLMDYFCAKCGKRCFDGILECYIGNVLKEGRQRLSCSKTAARIVAKDQKRLLHFFDKDFKIKIKLETVRKRGYVEDQLQIMTAIAEVLAVDNPWEASENFHAFQKGFGADVFEAAILETARLRNDMTLAKMESWQEIVGFWSQNHMDDSPLERGQTGKPTFLLPHLKKAMSKYKMVKEPIKNAPTVVRSWGAQGINAGGRPKVPFSIAGALKDGMEMTGHIAAMPFAASATAIREGVNGLSTIGGGVHVPAFHVMGRGRGGERGARGLRMPGNMFSPARTKMARRSC
jgi:hypothetical protein